MDDSDLDLDTQDDEMPEVPAFPFHPSHIGMMIGFALVQVGSAIAEIGDGFRGLMVSYDAHASQRTEFHHQAALEIETMTGGLSADE